MNSKKNIRIPEIFPIIIGRQKPIAMGNAKCGECKKDFKFSIDDYFFLKRFHKKRFLKCTHCGNTEKNSIIVFDPNGNELNNDIINEYVKQKK